MELRDEASWQPVVVVGDEPASVTWAGATPWTSADRAAASAASQSAYRCRLFRFMAFSSWLGRIRNAPRQSAQRSRRKGMPPATPSRSLPRRQEALMVCYYTRFCQPYCVLIAQAARL